MNWRTVTSAVCLLCCPVLAAPRVTLDLAEKMRPGETVVWTAGMQSAIDRTIGAKSELKLIGVRPENPLIEKLVAFEWQEEQVMPEGGWMVEAGTPEPALAERATRRWRELAGGEAAGFELPDVRIPGIERERAIVAFAGIFRRLEFVQAFATSRTVPLDFQSGPGESLPVRFF